MTENTQLTLDRRTVLQSLGAAAGASALPVGAASAATDYDTVDDQFDLTGTDPIEVLNTVEATAEDVHTAYTPWNIGAGFADATAAVRRAESGDFAKFNEVELVDPDTDG